MTLIAEEPCPHISAARVEDRDERHQHDNQRRRLSVFEQVERRDDLQPEPARTHHAERRRGTQIMLPPVDRRIHEPR